MKENLLVVLNSTAALALVLAASPASAQQNDARDLSAAEFVRRAAIGNLFELRSSRLATSQPIASCRG